jgi:hypothetical protein
MCTKSEKTQGRCTNRFWCTFAFCPIYLIAINEKLRSSRILGTTKND